MDFSAAHTGTRTYHHYTPSPCPFLSDQLEEQRTTGRNEVNGNEERDDRETDDSAGGGSNRGPMMNQDALDNVVASVNIEGNLRGRRAMESI